LDYGVLSQFDAVTLTFCFVVAIVAGVVKGAVGFALPLIIVSGVSMVADPKVAIAALLVSTLVTNALQTFREGVVSALDALQEYWRYVFAVCLFIYLSAQLVPYIPSRVFYFVLGIPVVGLSLIQLMGVKLVIPMQHRRKAEWGIGALSGSLGGFAGTWGPTTVLYLLAIETPKARQMIVQGVVYGAGSVTLLTAHWQSGILNKETAPLSFAILPAALIGLWIGFRIQDRLDQTLFKRITLIVLIIAGINLLRKGLLG
jgi:uncharacterized membrane protein YfcA